MKKSKGAKLTKSGRKAKKGRRILLFLKGCLALIGALTVLLVLFLSVSYFFLLQPSPLVQEMRLVPITSQGAADFDTKYAAFQTALEQASPGDTVALTITETEAVAKIAQLRERGELPQDLPLEVKGNIQVNFQDNEIWASADVSAYGATVKAGARARVELNEQSQLKVEIIRVEMGKSPFLLLNETLRIRNLVLDELKDLELSRLPVNLKSITLQERQLVLAVTRQ